MVKEVSNRPQMVQETITGNKKGAQTPKITVQTETKGGGQAFLDLLEQYRKLGYSGVQVVLARNGDMETCKFWIDSFLAYSSTYTIRGISVYDGDIQTAIQDMYNNYVKFYDFKERMENSIKEYMERYHKEMEAQRRKSLKLP